jgi:hypothetical protein
MLALLVTGAAVTILLGVGLVLAVLDAVRPGPAGDPDGAVTPVGPAGPELTGGVSSTAAGGIVEQDQLAARPMPAVPESASHPLPVSLADPGPPIVLPRSGAAGPAGVPTGFPHTPEGALAQLAAIDTAALSSASMTGVRAVIAGWAVPGGPSPTSWSGVRAMAGLLNSAEVTGGPSQLAVVATPSMGLVKGTVGPDFVVACVDFAIAVTVNTTARGAIADCQRMVWSGARWMIGAGAEPVDPPSVWPGSDLALQVGYRELRRG